MRGDGRVLLEECRRAYEAMIDIVDMGALRAEATRFAGILADPAH
jgi:hypothetical protein